MKNNINLKTGDIFYSINERLFSIESLEYFRDDLFFNGIEYNEYFLHKENIPEIFKNKDKAIKFLLKLLNKKIKEFKPFKNEKIENKISYNDIKIGNEFYILYDYEFFKIHVVFKVKYINDENGGIVYFIDKNSYDCDFIESDFNGLERLFLSLDDIKGEIYEKLCLKLYEFGIENYIFDDEEVVYYIENFKIHERKMKYKEIFKHENGFLFKKHAELFLKEMFEKEIEKIDMMR